MGKIRERISGLATAYLAGCVLADAVQREEARRQRLAFNASITGEDAEQHRQRITALEQKMAEAAYRRRLGK